MSSAPLSLGLMLPTHAPREQKLDPGSVGQVAAWAEERGLDALWAGDHIVHPWHFMECLMSLSFAAARTHRISIGTCVLLLPMRQISIAAAQVATLAALSGGRFRLGIGVGGEWPREWQAAGVPIRERGARLDEALPLLLRLFAGETVEAAGRFNDFTGVSLSPLPPRIPIYLAGRAPAALRRIARYGDGWLGFFLTPNGFRRDAAAIDAARTEAGRGARTFERGILLNFHFDSRDDAALDTALELNLGFAQGLTLAGSPEQLKRFALAGTPDTVLARLREYIAAGCTTFCFAPIRKDPAGYQTQIDLLVREVLPRLRAGD